MEAQDFFSSGIVLFDAKDFDSIHKALYREVVNELLNDGIDVAYADDMILEFYHIFEHEKKMIVVETDNKDY